MALPPAKDLQVLGPVAIWGDAGDAFPRIVISPEAGKIYFGSGAAVATQAVDLNADGLALVDNDLLRFGSASSGDVSMRWNGTLMEFGPQGSLLWSAAPSPGMSNYDTEFVHYFNDFLDSTIAVATQWTVTETSANATQVIQTDNATGFMQLDLVDTDDNDGVQISFIQENFLLATGKQLWFEARCRFPDAEVTQLDWFVGMIGYEDMIAVADNMPANGFGFRKDDGDLKVDAFTSDNGVNIESTNVDTLVTNVWVKYGLHIDGGATGASTMTPYIDGVAGTPVLLQTYATMAEVSPTFMVRNGDGVAGQIIDIDYVKVVATRP